MFVPFSNVELSLSKLTAILYFLTILPEINFFIRTERLEKVLTVLWSFFGLLTIVSIININEVSTTFFNITIFQNIILFWFLLNHARKDYLILERGMLFFAVGNILMSFLYLFGIGIVYEDGRLSMFNENQNALGLNMVLGIVILLLNVIQDKLKIGKIRLAFILPIPVMLNFVFATGSRLAFVSLIACILGGIVLLNPEKKINKVLVIFSGVLFLLVIAVLLSEHEVLRERILLSAQEGDISGRDKIWSKIVLLIMEHPIFGVGNTGYSLFTRITFGGDLSPHNVILEVLALTGAAGLLIYLFFLTLVLSFGYESYRKKNMLQPLLLPIPLLGLIFSGQILTSKIGWIIFAYIIGSTAIKVNLNHQLKLSN